jgi:protein associated with RNAse G/E
MLKYAIFNRLRTLPPFSISFLYPFSLQYANLIYLCRLKVLQPYIDQGIATVVDWSMFPYRKSQFNSQIMAFNDCVYRFKDYNEFQLQMDVDEYPFSLDKKIPDLDTLIEKYKTEEPDFGQLLLTVSMVVSY